MKKHLFYSGLICGIIGLGIICGVGFRQWQRAKTVAFRLSTPVAQADYDLIASINYLAYKFKQNGYRVLPWFEGGNFYFNESDEAGINVFIRGFSLFYDTRMNSKAIDVYYLPRVTSIYLEELRNYDYYLSSQKGLVTAMGNPQNMRYMGSGAVFHKLLKPDYKYDVLYIYEQKNEAYAQFLNSHYQTKIYGGFAFAKLDEKQRKKELESARLVVYEAGNNPLDDADYVPFAVYDIISYGRPILTNFNPHLEKIGVKYLFYHPEDMIHLTENALSENSRNLENNALILRDKVLKLENNDWPDFW